jgi:hypothetical protein
VSDLERLAYDNAIRALDKQEKLLEELRARTGVLLAAASLAASLLGGQAFDDVRPVTLLITALAAFALSFGASLFVLLPRSFIFALEGPRVYEQLYEFRDDTAEIHRRSPTTCSDSGTRTTARSRRCGARSASRRGAW